MTLTPDDLDAIIKDCVERNDFGSVYKMLVSTKGRQVSTITIKPKPKLGAIPGSATARLRVPVSLDADSSGDGDVLRNCVIAQVGPFKSDGRGEFDQKSLDIILDLSAKAPSGLKCSFCHADESSDGLGRFLGRFKNFRMGVVGVRESYGELKTNTVACVRADLNFDPTSHATPEGDLGKYVMDLAHSDPQALSSSLVLTTDMETRLNPDGTPKLDANGDRLPPLWRPTKIMGSDIVSVGDAVDGLLSHGLSIESLPDAILYKAEQMLNKQFAGKDRDYVESHLTAFAERYLSRRFPEEFCCGNISIDSKLRRSAANLLRVVGDLKNDFVGREWPELLAAVGAIQLAMAEDSTDSPIEDVSMPQHDGCRSTLAYHHLSMCRSCGATISACGCDNVANESRVVTMAKEPCGACLAAAAGDGEKPPQADDAQPDPDASSDAPDTTDQPQGVSAQDRRRREMMINILEL